ncbi:MAG: DNA-binding protein, partial [Erysipelotrichia bacterium]|nr:DNA-binding protein [Erysipelotrichia bacterium]
DRTGLSIPTIWRYVQAGIIPAYKMGGMTWRVSEEALQHFLTGSEFKATQNQ